MKFCWLLLALVSKTISLEENVTQADELNFFGFPNIHRAFFEEVMKANENKSDTCLSQLKTLVLNVFDVKNPKNILSEYRSKLELKLMIAIENLLFSSV